MNQTELLESLRAQTNGNRRTISLIEVWQAFDECHRHILPERRRHVLADALSGLAENDKIKLPVPKSPNWDRTETPPLPTQIVLTIEAKRSEQPWRVHTWHPSLAWVSRERTLSPAQFEFLQRVNNGLYGNKFQEVVTKKYRSLTLTGHEKRLDSLERTNLFAPDRLTPELLGYEEIPSPLRHHRIRPGGRWLVFENEELYGLVVKASVAQGGHLPNFPWDAVACGHGHKSTTALKWFVALAEEVKEIEYIGDIDKAGLNILDIFKRTSVSLGLPEVQPAESLVQEMQAEASRLGWQNGLQQQGVQAVPNDQAEAAAQSLPEAHRAWAVNMLTGGRRVPEEILARHVARLVGPAS